jgi:RNA polymerase sigma-70 factor (ECF subfamily)
VEREDKDLIPEEQVLENEVKNLLKQSCESLKHPYQEIALDYFYYEMSMQMIADKYEKNLKTIQTQIYRAREMLKKTYGKGVQYEIGLSRK